MRQKKFSWRSGKQKLYRTGEDSDISRITSRTGLQPMREIRFSQFAAKGIHFCRVHIDRLEKQGRFPKRFHLGENSVAWLEDEIDAWIKERADARHAAAVPAQAA